MYIYLHHSDSALLLGLQTYAQHAKTYFNLGIASNVIMPFE